MVHFLASAIRRQCSVIPFAIAVGLAAPAVLIAAPRAIANEFATCTSTLLEVGLEATDAAAACGKALHPVDLSRCALTITGVASVDATQALVACQNDRRPQELATCVDTIHQGLEVANSTAVLNNCRRSVLPLRFADCVVGVATAADLTATASMAQCNAAGFRPQDVAPSFIFSR
jgi:hypothetical protein